MSEEIAKRKYYTSSSQSNKNKETNESKICYICGCNGGNWSLYTKENDKEKSPYFPFLELIEKAEGANVLKEDGRIDACTVCFSFLIQQWHSYEEIGTPIEKRNYWLKTTATGANIDFYRDPSYKLETDRADENCFEKKQDATQRSSQSREKSNQVSPVEDTVTDDIKEQGEMSAKKFPINNNKSNSDENDQLCFVCGAQLSKDIMTTVHTKPQLRKEIPFYPNLVHHSCSSDASRVGFTGKIMVCEHCDMLLLQQWQEFQQKDIPLSKRHYDLPAKKSNIEMKPSEFAPCFICEERYPESTLWNMFTKPKQTGKQYFSFLSRLSPLTGTTLPGEQGLVQACMQCHHSLVDQWKVFEHQQVPEHERKYSYKTKRTRTYRNVGGYNATCSMCKQSYPSHKMEYIEQVLGNKNIIPQSKSDNEQSLVCYHCKNVVMGKDTAYNIQQDGKANNANEPVSNCVNTVKTDEPTINICFLCGEQVPTTESKKLFVLPQQCTDGYKPFFPSLAYRVPAYQAKPPTVSGTVIVCCYCHGNMMNQWYTFQETSGMSNPWARNYILSQFICYLCGNVFPRQKITSISSSDYSFLKQVRRPIGAFRMNEEYVVCHNCKEIIHVQKENFGKCNVNIYEREYELPMVRPAANSNWTETGNSGESYSSSHHHPVVVIGDSESEGEEQSGQLSDNLLTAKTGLQEKGVHQNLPMSSPAATAAQNSSFAAALRKLAKQAMSPGSTATVPPTNNQTPVKGGESPKLNGNPGGFKKEVPDAAFLNSKENRGHPNVPSAVDVMATSMGHQVLPGVFSLGPRGLDSKSNPLEEHHGPGRMQDIPRLRAVHPQPPFYVPFLQRPPINDSVYMSPFHYYPPPPMVDGMIPPGFDHETWRKRRAMEHLRQQHERHTHYFPSHERPLYITDQDHLKPMPGQTTSQRPYLPDLPQQTRENNFGKNNSRTDSNTISDPRSLGNSPPKEMEKNVEIVSPRIPSSRSEHTPVITSCSSRNSSATVQNSQTHGSTSRDGEGELDEDKEVKQREHQIMWTRKMFEQKRRIRQEEIEWQHRQQQMRQQKREVQQELYQFRQKLLQQKESELGDSSKKNHDEVSEKDNDTITNEVTKGKSEMMDKMVFPAQYSYPLCHDQPSVHHLSSMYRPQQHEIYCPPSFQQPSRLDTGIYREYLRQSPHVLDNKAVSEWLEKQKHPDGEIPEARHFAENSSRYGPVGLVFNGNVDKDMGKHSHEPLKLKFMKDLGLMTVSDKIDQAQTVLRNEKRKLTEDVAADESNKENRFENGECISDSAKSAKDVEQENDGEAYCKKVNFLYNVGLVTHRKRQELEDVFEKNRWERRAQRFQRRTKRTKKQKKEEKERNRSKTPLDVSGPMTRQKQQLLQEYGLLLPIKDSQEKDSSSDSTTVDNKEKDSIDEKEQDEIKEEKIFRSSYEVSTPPPPRSNTFNPAPQLTLQSITHMENPYGIPSAFRPPYYRTGLSSDQKSNNDHPLFQKKHTFLGPNDALNQSIFAQSQPAVLSNGIDCPVPSVYTAHATELQQPPWVPSNNEIPKWPGPTNIVRSYLEYHKDQENELSVLKEKSKKLKIENGCLNQESERVNSTYSSLARSKRKLEEDQLVLNGKLDKMHNFLIFVQNR